MEEDYSLDVDFEGICAEEFQALEDGTQETKLDDLSLPWCKFPEVVKALEIHTLRELYRSRVKQMTELHPFDLQNAEAFHLRYISDWDNELWLHQLVNRCTDPSGQRVSYLHFESRLSEEVVPQSVIELHDDLISLENIRNRSEARARLALGDERWFQYSREDESVYRAVVRMLSYHIRGMEWDILFPEMVLIRELRARMHKTLQARFEQRDEGRQKLIP